MTTLINLPVVHDPELGPNGEYRSWAPPPPAPPRERLKEHGDLYENAPTAYLWIDLDGVILRVNPRARELLGYEHDELVDCTVPDLCADIPEGRGKAERLFGVFRDGELIHDEDLVMMKSDGEPIWVSLTVYPILDSFGRLVGGRSMVLDVSQRKLVEACF